jgi:hypothetical protein
MIAPPAAHGKSLVLATNAEETGKNSPPPITKSLKQP